MSSSANSNSSKQNSSPQNFIPPISQRIQPFMKPTIWHQFTPLALKHQAVNLGQGFPDWEAPEFVKEAAIKSIRDNQNQYAPSQGEPALLDALLKTHQHRFNSTQTSGLNQDCILTTVGVTEGLYATFQALLNPGDEVILMEPTFDIYPAQVELAGGVVKYIPLRNMTTRVNQPQNKQFQLPNSSQDLSLDFDELKSLVTEKTKAILINTPHNPTGKIFTRQELLEIREIILSHPSMIAIVD
eukprot:Sdes_comp21982_c0_seq1m20522